MPNLDHSGDLWLADSHVHSTHSCDARSTLTEMCQRAVELGLHFICFTEHLDLDPRDDGYRYFRPEAYFAEIEAARAQFRGQLTIGAGVEVCYQSQREDEIADWLERWPFDFVLGSVHIVEHGDDWVMVPDRASMLAWSACRTVRNAYLPYFEELRRAASSGLFDALAHLDLVKRYGTLVYGPFDRAAFADELDAVLEAALAYGTAIEINTSGLFQPAGETFPGLDTVRRYRELGGCILTIGSDSHDIHQLGRGLDVAIAQAQAAGFTEIACFLQRRPQLYPLPAIEAQEATA
ncbi:MAG: histidinol-phosphatase [Anaerolineae bacterium]|nr:histidinol-phosphatase [Anaerolineae bacterium]